jgi:hypothetical protein
LHGAAIASVPPVETARGLIWTFQPLAGLGRIDPAKRRSRQPKRTRPVTRTESRRLTDLLLQPLSARTRGSRTGLVPTNRRSISEALQRLDDRVPRHAFVPGDGSED